MFEKTHVVGTHVMWYEIEMLDEYLASILNAIKHARWPVRLYFFLNGQTHLEQPVEGVAVDDLLDSMKIKLTEFNEKIKEIDSVRFKTYFPDLYIDEIIDSEEAYQVQIALGNGDKLDARIRFNTKINVTVADMNTANDYPLYNIGAFRRDVVNMGVGYTIWGEIDALYPHSYFQILEMLGDADDISKPYIVSFASRKCWDETWTLVEHTDFQTWPCTREGEKAVPQPYNWDDYITQEQLDEFNKAQTKAPPLVQLNVPKIDGSLLAFSTEMPQLIPNDMSFAREDWNVQLMMEYVYPHIKQYHLPTILKGHNYKHPKKRMYTDSTRDSKAYLRAVNDSMIACVQQLERFGWKLNENGTCTRIENYVE